MKIIVLFVTNITDFWINLNKMWLEPDKDTSADERRRLCRVKIYATFPDIYFDSNEQREWSSKSLFPSLSVCRAGLMKCLAGSTWLVGERDAWKQWKAVVLGACLSNTCTPDTQHDRRLLFRIIQVTMWNLQTRTLRCRLYQNQLL